MAIEITGRLIKKLPQQSGTSTKGEWKKQEFIIETQENFPKKICMNVWGAEKVDELAGYGEGENLKISVNIESREFNQRWYTDVRAWKVERLSEGVQEQAKPRTAGQSEITDPFSSDGGEDDLPF
ncbi:MAG: DUF3127 domain-containing protein [Bacteroidales bacterium]|jgi:hypothetical protein